MKPMMKKPKRWLSEEVINAQVRCRGCSHIFSVDLASLDQLNEVFCDECLADPVELLSYGRVTRLIENPDYAIWKLWRDVYDESKYKQSPVDG